MRISAESLDGARGMALKGDIIAGPGTLRFTGTCTLKGANFALLGAKPAEPGAPVYEVHGDCTFDACAFDGVTLKGNVVQERGPVLPLLRVSLQPDGG